MNVPMTTEAALDAAEALNDALAEHQPSPVLALAQAYAILFVDAISEMEVNEEEARKFFCATLARLIQGMIIYDTEADLETFCGTLRNTVVAFSRIEPCMLTDIGGHA